MRQRGKTDVETGRVRYTKRLGGRERLRETGRDIHIE